MIVPQPLNWRSEVMLLVFGWPCLLVGSVKMPARGGLPYLIGWWSMWLHTYIHRGRGQRELWLTRPGLRRRCLGVNSMDLMVYSNYLPWEFRRLLIGGGSSKVNLCLAKCNKLQPTPDSLTTTSNWGSGFSRYQTWRENTVGLLVASPHLHPDKQCFISQPDA